MGNLLSKSGKPIVQTTTPTPNAQAQPLWQQLLSSAMTGAKALGGDAGSLQSFMNPSWSVLAPFFSMLRGQATTRAQDTATATGGGGAAFDSTRAAAMAGAEQAGVSNIESQMKYQDVNNALTRALQLSSGVMGMGMGQTQTTPTEWSPLGAMAGLAMTPFAGGTGALGLFGPGASKMAYTPGGNG
jgi:hypothetical protein